MPSQPPPADRLGSRLERAAPPAQAAEAGSRTNAPRTTVLYTLGKLHVGGAEMRSLQLFRRLLADHPDVRVIVYVISGRAAELDDAFRAAGAELRFGRHSLASLVDVWRICRRERVRVLHSNVATASGFFCIPAVLAGVPIRICHFRTLGGLQPGFAYKVQAAVGRLLINLLSTKVIGVCDAARRFAWTPEWKWRTLYNGIEADPACAEAGAPSSPGGSRRGENIAFLGRLSPEKNGGRAIDIFAAFLRSRPGSGALLHFYGIGPEEQALRERSAAAGLKDRVVFHGHAADPIASLKSADCLLLPSLREGLPGSVLEALSVGTPVVASDLPGVLEIAGAVTGVTALPVSADDERWAEAVGEALAADRRADIAASFKRGPFNFETFIAGIEELWGIG